MSFSISYPIVTVVFSPDVLFYFVPEIYTCIRPWCFFTGQLKSYPPGCSLSNPTVTVISSWDGLFYFLPPVKVVSARIFFVLPNSYSRIRPGCLFLTKQLQSYSPGCRFLTRQLQSYSPGCRFLTRQLQSYPPRMPISYQTVTVVSARMPISYQTVTVVSAPDAPHLVLLYVVRWYIPPTANIYAKAVSSKRHALICNLKLKKK